MLVRLTRRGQSYALFADYKPGEPRDAHVLAGLRCDLSAEVLDRLAVVGIGAHVFLLQEGDLPRPLRQLSVDDLPHDVVGLSLLAGLCLEHPALGLAHVIRDLVGRYIDRRRGSPGDVDRHLAGELPELVAAGDEVRLALHLDEHADPSGGVDVRRDDPLARRSSASLRAEAWPF